MKSDIDFVYILISQYITLMKLGKMFTDTTKDLSFAAMHFSLMELLCQEMMSQSAK